MEFLSQNHEHLKFSQISAKSFLLHFLITQYASSGISFSDIILILKFSQCKQYTRDFSFVYIKPSPIQMIVTIMTIVNKMF